MSQRRRHPSNAKGKTQAPRSNGKPKPQPKPADMPAHIGQTLDSASLALEAVSDTPRLDAELLMAYALKTTRAKLMARLQETILLDGFSDLLERRLCFEPIAYILGEWEFFSLELSMRAPILVPRPETEHLVEAVLRHVEVTPGTILELGTGSGCVAVALAAHATACRVVATDINPAALQLARANAERQAVASRIRFRQGDWFKAVLRDDGPFQAICSNPPYIEESQWQHLSPVIRMHEDPKALLAGEDGLDSIRLLIKDAMQWLVPGGLLAFEMGESHYEAVRPLLEQHGYCDIEFHPDLAGIPRIATALAPGGPSPEATETE